jgi:hypothetical protein
MLFVTGCGPNRDVTIQEEAQPMTEAQKAQQKSYEEAYRQQNKMYESGGYDKAGSK